jgi:hypothetical protein
MDRDDVSFSPTALTMTIPTPDGPHTASAGDWIVRGMKGEHFSCKPDIFEANYEPAT